MQRDVWFLPFLSPTNATTASTRQVQEIYSRLLRKLTTLEDKYKVETCIIDARHRHQTPGSFHQPTRIENASIMLGKASSLSPYKFLFFL